MKILLLLLLSLLTVAAAGADKCHCDYDRRAVVCSRLQLTRFQQSDTSCGHFFWQIDVSQNMLQSFPNDLHQFKIVNISHNALHLLYAAHDQKVEDLDVSGNFITEIHLGNAFQHLRHLSAPVNRLGTLGDDFLNGYCGLVYLDVSSNGLTSLDTVTKCTRLSILVAAHNKITNIPENFSKFNKLENLDLSDNGLMIMVTGIPTSVKILNLADNYITRLDVTTFKWLVSLNDLDLSFNAIGILERGAFQSLTSLESLSLYGNNLQILTEETFQGLNSLKKLRISYNDIMFVADDTFSHLASLESLFLNANLLTTVPALRFGKYVKEVGFMGNAISQMNMSALMVMFSGSEVLRVVDFKMNLLRGDDPEWSKVVREFDWMCYPEANLREAEGHLRGFQSSDPRLGKRELPRGICPCAQFRKEDNYFHVCISEADKMDGVPWLVAAEMRASEGENEHGYITRAFDDEL